MAAATTVVTSIVFYCGDGEVPCVHGGDSGEHISDSGAVGARSREVNAAPGARGRLAQQRRGHALGAVALGCG
eukprot:IDg13667t1